MPQNERQNGITERKFSSYENLLHRYILASYRSRNKGLLYGQLGSAIILYSIARNPRFSAVEPTADDLLDKALKDLPDNLPIGLATGLTGYCWGVEYLTYKQYIECIPNEVCESLILNIQKSRKYDVLSENEMKRVVGGSDSGSGSDIDKLTKHQGTMYKNIIYVITIAVLLLSCKGNSSKGTVADKPLLAINPAEFVEKSFNLSDFADSIVFIELSPDYPFSGKVEQITSDRMIVYDRYKSFKYFDRQGKILGEIGKVGQGADEYPQNTSFSFSGSIKCFYDNCRNLYAVYSDIPTKRGLRLRYYDHQGEYYGSIRLNTPYQGKELPHIFFSEEYFYLLAYPSTLNTEDAVLCFDNKGNLVREYSYDANRACFSRGVEMPTNYYRDHLLLWGFNDTIYEVRGKECTPVYRWDIPQDMRRKLEERDFKNMGVGAVQDNEFSPHLILDTKKWLIVHGYIIPSFHYYYYNKEEGEWYGDSAPNNDLGYYTFGNAMCFFDGYYYDEKKDEEWLYHTFSPGDRLLDLLEETDDPRSISMRKGLSEKDDINPILVMVRLKK